MCVCVKEKERERCYAANIIQNMWHEITTATSPSWVAITTYTAIQTSKLSQNSRRAQTPPMSANNIILWYIIHRLPLPFWANLR